MATFPAIDTVSAPPSSLSSTSSYSSSPTDEAFPFFARLPPEIRHTIYIAAIPSPGINFFNIHSFPNDHQGANRSNSPPNLHLDLRRECIEDDDECVAKYDPSVWQVRHALRQTCHEARAILAIPEDKAVRLTLTIPKRGLFVHAGDGLLRSMTPWAKSRPRPEPAVHRQIETHSDDVISMSGENCSFNILHEEGSPSSDSLGSGEDDDDDDAKDFGWSYDPQFGGGASLGIPEDRFCLNFKNCEITDEILENIGPALLQAATGTSGGRGSVMFDSDITSPSTYTLPNVPQRLPVFWDRWGDAYLLKRLDDSSDFAEFADTQLIKVRPEKEHMRMRYLRSAQLKSSKRPA
jgi:hypothetical protein